jgi:hypothetical protein
VSAADVRRFSFLGTNGVLVTERVCVSEARHLGCDMGFLEYALFDLLL